MAEPEKKYTFTKEQLARAIKIKHEAFAKAGVPIPSQEHKRLEAQGWEVWCRTLFPNYFSRPFTHYQKKFWEWGWQIEPKTYYRPRVECQPRGVGKSTNAEALVVNLVARKKRRMIGYVSLNEDKATKHFDTIKSMLESEALLKHYPQCKPKVQKLKDTAAQWSKEAIVTESGAMIVPLTLLGSSRGWKSSTGDRFDLLVLDDIDALGQSPDFTEKLIEMLKGEILAAGDDNTVVLMPQNLIHRDSICAKIQDHRADILSDREFKGPFPILRYYDAEKVDIKGDDTGAKEWVITSGEAYDEAISIEYAQKLLNKFGKRTFDRECQQLVNEIEDDKDFREWSEVHHLITHSEFRATMEELGEDVGKQTLKIPARWNVGMGFDNGTTLGHPSAVITVARPSEHSPLKNSHFVVGEVVLPKFPSSAFEKPELVSPGRVAQAIKQFLSKWGITDSQVTLRLMSHEASSAQNTMMVDLPDDQKEFFGKWKARKGSGIPQIQNLLEIDKTKPHPFRKYPQGTTKNGKDVSGQAILGCPRLFFLVADDQGELRCDPNGNLYVLGAKNADGLARLRFEMPLYSQFNTLQNKTNDDAVDAFRGIMNIFGAKPQERTLGEQLDVKMASHTTYGRELKDDMSLSAQISRSMAQVKAIGELRKEGWAIGADGREEEPEFEIDLSGGW